MPAIAAVTELQTRLNTLEGAVVDGKAEEAVNTAMKAGKLIPALKDWGLSLFKADPAKFETFVGSAPILTAPQLQTPRKDGEAADLTEAQLAVCSAMGITADDFKKTLKAEAKA
ncbi:hypothetical protein EN932_27115 [Mesorhizobium sp. M7A.F.Ca.US.002.01.1.1]|nr:hypothetical protein EN932_27115 [Mesorhizobium sp. M7A.F.Ca.US.002.01.1.1]